MHRCDVLIVGAGIAGASIAYEIARAAKVILLEGESQPRYHTTGRSAALYAPGYGNRMIRILTAASQAFYRDRAGGLAEHPVLTPRGALFVARQDQLASLDATFDEIRQQVPALERLDAAQGLARVPVLRSDYVAGGLYDPTSMDMDVAALHQGYIRGSRTRGGTLLTDAGVTKFARDGASWQIETRTGAFEAAVLVDAAGAWADQVATMAGLAPIGLTPMCRTAILFEASVPADAAWPIVLDADEQFYFKPESGLLLGSPADETPVPAADVQPEELDVAIAIDRIERAADFRVTHVRRKWAGLRTFAPDRTPVVGMDETASGFFWLAGQGGYGIQMAPALARARRYPPARGRAARRAGGTRPARREPVAAPVPPRPAELNGRQIDPKSPAGRGATPAVRCSSICGSPTRNARPTIGPDGTDFRACIRSRPSVAEREPGTPRTSPAERSGRRPRPIHTSAHDSFRRTHGAVAVPPSQTLDGHESRSIKILPGVKQFDQVSTARIERRGHNVPDGAAANGRVSNTAGSWASLGSQLLCKSDKSGSMSETAKIGEAGSMGKTIGVLLIILGVLANNVVYLQDLWLGQDTITLDGWRAYGGLLVSILIIIAGLVLLARSRPAV